MNGYIQLVSGVLSDKFSLGYPLKMEQFDVSHETQFYIFATKIAMSLLCTDIKRNNDMYTA